MSTREGAMPRARARRALELAPLRDEVGAAIARVGRHDARPVVVAVMAPVRVDGPKGRWWARVGKRKGAQLLRALAGAPVRPRQLALNLDMASLAGASHPAPTLAEGR